MFYSSATASSLPLPSSIGRTVVSVEGEKWKVEVSYSSATSLLPLLLSSIGRTVVSVEGEKWKVEFGESVEGEKWKVEFGESVEGGRWKVESGSFLLIRHLVIAAVAKFHRTNRCECGR